MRTRLRGMAAGALSGALGVLAFPPAGLSALALFAFAPFLAHLRAARGREAGLSSLALGAVYFSGGLFWLRTVITPAGPVLLGLLLAVLFFWPAGHAMAALLRRGLPLLLAAPLAWFAFEWIRHWLFTGFPWLLLSHALADWTLFVQAADLFGATGLAAVVVLVNAAAAEVLLALLARRPGGALRPAAVAAVALGLVFLYGALRLPAIEERPGPRALLVQGNVPQFMKQEAWRRGREMPTTAEELLALHLTLTREGLSAHPEADLVVWPETMFPYRTTDEEGAAAEAVRRVVTRCFAAISAAAGGRPVIFGSMHRTREGKTRNSVYLLGPDGRVEARYDKNHAVPGGEYLPLRTVVPAALGDFVARLVRENAGFAPELTEGEGPVLLPAAGVRLGPLVCFEICYPGLLREQRALGADVFVNLTNYGWFPGTAQPEQATQMAVLRAVEARRPVLVAANTGISGVVSARGALSALETGGRRYDVRGVFLARVPLCGAGSPYTLLGDAPAAAAGVAVLALIAGPWLLARLRRERKA